MTSLSVFCPNHIALTQHKPPDMTKLKLIKSCLLAWLEMAHVHCMSAIKVADTTQQITGCNAQAHKQLRLRRLLQNRKKVCSGQHRFSNDFSGNGAGKPHFSLSSVPYLWWTCANLYLLVCKRTYLPHAFSVGVERAKLHFMPKPLQALQPRFHLWLQLIQSGAACRWCCAPSGTFSSDVLTFERLQVCQHPGQCASVRLCHFAYWFPQVLGSNLQKNLKKIKAEGKGRILNE